VLIPVTDFTVFIRDDKLDCSFQRQVGELGQFLASFSPDLLKADLFPAGLNLDLTHSGGLGECQGPRLC